MKNIIKNNEKFHFFDSALPIEIYNYDFDIVTGAYSGALITLPHYRNIPAQLEMKELYQSGIDLTPKKCCALFDNFIPSFAEMKPFLNLEKTAIFKN